MPMDRQEISSLLERSGITPTPQRVEIAAIMLACRQHLSADQVLTRVNRNGAAVSKATVYNTLGLFAEKGLLREVIVDPTKVFYDSNVSPHHHFYNVDDGSLTDFDASECAIVSLPPLPAGTVADGVDVIVRVRNAPAQT
ncbi:MAG: Fur family transcriptional regulator [Chromatiales bacterium]